MSAIFDLISKEVCEPVTIDGKTFFVRYLTALQRDKFEEQWTNYRTGNSVAGIRGFMCAFCLCDKDGKPEFNSGSKEFAGKEFTEAAKKIGEIKSTKLQPLFSKVMEINGFSAEDVEELEKK